jgi:hypothetical protein
MVVSILNVAGLGACATDSSSSDQLTAEPSDTVHEQIEQPTDAAVPTPEEVTPAPPVESTAAPIVMPDLVGMNLQVAQDALQALGSYILDQEDASGLDRLQIIDSNWHVCAQEPAPGSTIQPEALIILSSVKLEESCP